MELERCLYAELTKARIDKGTADLQAALRRTGNMTITRLTANGAYGGSGDGRNSEHGRVKAGHHGPVVTRPENI